MIISKSPQTEGSSVKMNQLNQSNNALIKKKLKAVELDLFSYRVPVSEFEGVLAKVCGQQFKFDKLNNDIGHSGSFMIAPQDHCLVDGGMMYTSAASIVKQLSEKGLLIMRYKAIIADH